MAVDQLGALAEQQVRHQDQAGDRTGLGQKTVARHAPVAQMVAAALRP
jgi:hypothetical protein